MKAVLIPTWLQEYEKERDMAELHYVKAGSVVDGDYVEAVITAAKAQGCPLVAVDKIDTTTAAYFNRIIDWLLNEQYRSTGFI